MGNRTVAPQTRRVFLVPDDFYTTAELNPYVPTAYTQSPPAPTQENSSTFVPPVHFTTETQPIDYSIGVTSPTSAVPVISPKFEAPIIPVDTTIPSEHPHTDAPVDYQTVVTSAPVDNQAVSSTSEQNENVLPEHG